MRAVAVSRVGLLTSTPISLLAAAACGLGVAGIADVVTRWPKPGLAATVAVILILWSIQKLEVGLILLVVLAYSQGFTVIKNSSDLPSGAFPLAVIIAALTFLAGRRGVRFLPRAAESAVVAFAAYGVWLLASAAWAQEPDVTLRAAGAYWKLMLMVVVVLALVRTPRVLALTLWSVVGAATLLAMMTVAQHFDAGLTFFGFAGSPVHELTSTGEVTRAVGPIGNPNAYAQMLVVAVPLAFARLVCERLLALRLLAIGAVVLCGTAILLTYSRGGFLGLAVVLTLSLLRHNPRIAIPVVGLVVAILVAGAVSGSYSSRIGSLQQALPWRSDSTSSDPSIRGRAAFLRAGLHMWREHPLGGVGYANYPVNYVAYNRGVGTDPTLGDSAHDTPLQVLSETGAVGLVLWLTLAGFGFASLARARNARGVARKVARGTADGLAISLVGYLITSLFIGGAYLVLAWLLLALCVSARTALEAPSMSSIRRFSIASQR